MDMTHCCRMGCPRRSGVAIRVPLPPWMVDPTRDEPRMVAIVRLVLMPRPSHVTLPMCWPHALDLCEERPDVTMEPAARESRACGG